jgi:VWFA-related protein
MGNSVELGASGVPDANSSSGTAEFSTGGGASGESSFTLAKAVLPGYTIRRTVPEVRLQFTVADNQGRLLKSISSDDIRVLDNRIAIQRIHDFSRREDLPLQVGILLDISDSVERNARQERQATQFFIAHIFRPQTDRIALMAFSHELQLWQRSTGERDTLAQALDRIPQRGYITYLYDSVYHACLEQFSPVQEEEAAQRILVLISDGEDTGSIHPMADAISAAQRREVQIFTVSVHSARQPAPGDKVLKQLSESTGGELFVATTEKDFPAIFSAMEQQMRTRYAVTFEPVDRTPGFHTVQIEMAGDQKFRVHARNGYSFDAP